MAGISFDSMVLLEDPIRYWRLQPSEAGDGTEVADELGGALATLRGDWRPGSAPTTQIGGAVHYGGGDVAWIDAGDGRLLGTTPGMTLEAWVIAKRPPYLQTSLSGPWSPQSAWLLGTMASPSAYGVRVTSDGVLVGIAGGITLTTPIFTLPEYVWTYLVWTSGAAGSFLYVNGEQVAGDPDAIFAGTLDDLGMSHSLGGQPGGVLTSSPYDSPQYVRAVSRVAVYDRQLSPVAVAAHWGARFGTEDVQTPSTNTQFDNKVVALGASHYWKLGEDFTADGGIAADAIGVQNGIYRGTVTPTDGPTAAESRAVAIDGTAGDRVEIAGAPWLSGSDDWALAWWGIANDPTSWETYLGTGSAADSRLIWAYHADSGQVGVFLNNANYVSPTVTTKGVWHLFVINTTGRIPAIWVDGIKVFQGTGAYIAPASDGGTTKILGKPADDATSGLQGAMSRLARIDRALSDAEIDELWQSRNVPADPVDLRDVVTTFGPVYLKNDGTPDTPMDALYRIELAVKGYLG